MKIWTVIAKFIIFATSMKYHLSLVMLQVSKKSLLEMNIDKSQDPLSEGASSSSVWGA